MICHELYASFREKYCWKIATSFVYSKFTNFIVSFHFVFQLVSANLPQRDDDNNNSYGYRENHVKLGIRRASRLVIILRNEFHST